MQALTLYGWMLEEPDSGAPLLMLVKEGKWVDVVVDLDDIEKKKDAGPQKEWSCYRTAFLEVDGEEDEGGEIPFWAMKTFHAFYNELPKKKQVGMLTVEYKRTVKGDNNTASWR